MDQGWIYDYFTSEEDKVVSSCSKAAFITEAIEKGLKSLYPLDPFFEFNSFVQ